jgi:hypothetical protein
MKIKQITMSLAASALALSLTQTASAQGWIDINNYDASAGLFLGSTATTAPLSTFVELLGGTSAGNMAGVVSQYSGVAINELNNPQVNGALNGLGTGTGTYFDAGAGAVPNLPNTVVGYFQFLAWVQGTGPDTSFAAAQYQFESAIWTQANGLQSVGNNSPNPALLYLAFANPIKGNTVNGPNGTGNTYEGLVMTRTPEPATLALAGLGGLGMLMAMRRKKT